MTYYKLTSSFLFAILLILIMACDRKKQSASDSAQQDSLIIKYSALQDSVASNWQKMIADDDYKHLLLNRLLLEVSYTNNYDKDRFNKLKLEIDHLKTMRYDQNSMVNSSVIDMYDSATWDLSDQVIEFARSHPRYQDFPLMEELIKDINAKNNYVLIHRIHYDNWAKELNTFGRNNSERLKDETPDFNSVDLPLFQLPS